MARSSGCRMLRASCHCRLRWKSPYNERNLECTRSPDALCRWYNLTNTRAAHRDPWCTLFRFAGPAPKKIRLSLVKLWQSEILTIFLCTLYTILMKFFVVLSHEQDTRDVHCGSNGFLSNQPFFLTEQPGVLKKEQNTATLGLIWWFGRKQGTW